MDRREGGMVTVEAALVLPTLVVLLALALWTLAAATATIRCDNAAAAAARAAGDGAPGKAVLALAAADAPSGAVVTVDRRGRLVTVRVETEVRPWGPVLHRLGAVRVSAAASAWVPSGPGVRNLGPAASLPQ